MEKIQKTITLDSAQNFFINFKYIKGLGLIVIVITNIINVISRLIVDNESNINVFSFFSFFGVSLYLFYCGARSTKTTHKKNISNSALFFITYLIINFLYIIINGVTHTFNYMDVVYFNDYMPITATLIPLFVVPLFAPIIVHKLKFLYKNVFVFTLFLLCIYLVNFSISNLGINIFNESLIVFIPYLIGIKFADYLENVNSTKIITRDLLQIILICILILIGGIFLNPLLPYKYDIFGSKQMGVGIVIGVIILLFISYILVGRLKSIFINRFLRRVYELDPFILVVHFVFLFVYIILFNYKFSELFLMVSSIIVIFISILLISNLFLQIGNKVKDGAKIQNKYFALNIIFVLVFFSLNFGLIYAESGKINMFPKPYLENVVVDNVEKLPNLDTYVSRNWVIKSTKLSKAYTKSILVVTLDYPLEKEYKMVVNIKGDRFNEDFLTTKIDGFNYKFEIDAAKFDIGKYVFYAKLTDLGIESPKNTFNISYPLFVTWTIDYEGGDVSDVNLNSMESIMNEFKIPVSHMFNPRIYMAGEISKSRREFLTNWVLNRHDKYNDEIALHMHMQVDMINSMGLKAKISPAWDDRTNGQSVLTTAYDYNEFTAMLLWAKNKFKENGLPRPYTYRAGGWFLGLPQLKALQDQGFKIDSSGRNAAVWGSVKQPWTLNEMTRPYKPSASNQNKSSPAPLINIWEFPNNGYDSTNNDVALMKRAFDLNFIGNPLSSAQTLTYLSHPNYFAERDANRMKELIEYINKYKAKEDNGPVFYFTVIDSLNNWD